MRKSRNPKAGRRSKATRSTRGSRAKNGAGRDDAISLLKADHREVERLFGEFEHARAPRQRDLAAQICQALRVHTTIEEEIFYPAFLAATEDKDLHHEAEIEHAGAKHLIGEIESTGAGDDHFEARVTVLQEMIKHHVKEEEQRGGMFSEAQSSDMDLAQLGRRMRERKLELMGEHDDAAASRERTPPEGRMARGSRQELPR